MLTLQISMKIEDEKLDSLINFLKTFLNVIETKILDDKSSFNWDAEAVISDAPVDNTSYYQIADELYSRLINDNKKFSDWEYKFISDLYAISEAKGHLTIKQKHWLDKLKEKHL